MPFVDFLVALFVAVVILFFLTQIVAPLRNNMPLFPFFRHPQRLEQELVVAQEDVVSAQVERQIEETKVKAATVRRRKPAVRSTATDPNSGSGK